MVKASAPGKLLLFGEHAVVYGKPCIVTAIDHRMNVSIEKRKDDEIHVDVKNMAVGKYIIKTKDLHKNHPKEFRFVLKAVENFFKKFKINCGLNIKTRSQFSSKIGFGSSAAVTVATLKALGALFDEKMNNRRIYKMGTRTVLDIQGVGSGIDVASSTYGGTLYCSAGKKMIKQIKIGKLPLIVGYTGVKAETPALIRRVAKLRKKHPELVNPVFDLLEKIAKEAKRRLEKREFKELGEIMNFNHGLLNAAKVSSIELERLISAARKAGAFGAKLSGAGGGDCMIAIAHNGKATAVKKAIRRAGGQVIDVKVNAEGARIEK